MELMNRQVLELWNRYKPTIAVDAIEYDRELKKLLGTNLAEVGTDATDINVGELISRQAAIDAIGEKSDEIYKTKQKGATYPHDDFFQGMAYAEDVVKQLPSAEPKRIRGQWITDKQGFVTWSAICNKCGARTQMFDGYYNFCPNCGAKMEETT